MGPGRHMALGVGEPCCEVVTAAGGVRTGDGGTGTGEGLGDTAQGARSGEGRGTGAEGTVRGGGSRARSGGGGGVGRGTGTEGRSGEDPWDTGRGIGTDRGRTGEGPEDMDWGHRLGTETRRTRDMDRDGSHRPGEHQRGTWKGDPPGDIACQDSTHKSPLVIPQIKYITADVISTARKNLTQRVGYQGVAMICGRLLVQGSQVRRDAGEGSLS